MTARLSDKQLTTVSESTGRVNIWEGAIRSGKTIGSLLRFLLFVATAPTTGEIVLVGRTRDAVWRNVIAPLQSVELFGAAAEHVVGNHGAPTVAILGRRCHVLGASDAKAEKVIRGMTVAGAYVDEVTTLPEEFFTQLLGRMSVAGAALFGTTNPDSPAHWLKKKFLDRLALLPGWRHWHFTLDDNPALTAAYVASIKAEFTGLWYRRFILGEWVAAEGAIYSMWDEGRHLVPWEQTPDMARLVGVGVDYGTTNATAALLLGQDHDGTMWMLDEYRYDPSVTQHRLTDQQLATQLRDWLATPHTPRPGPDSIPYVCVDPAAASFKVQLFNDHVRGVTDADNDVAYGIRTTASLLGTGQLKVTDRCSGFLSEVTGYSWDPKATEKGQDKPLKVADHSLDAARYAIATTEALWRPHLPDPATTPARAA